MVRSLTWRTLRQRENPKPEWFKLDAYLNLDDGTGKRAASVFGPPDAAAMVQNAMDNFKDWASYRVNPPLAARPVVPTAPHSITSCLPGVGLQPGSVRLQHLHAPHQLRSPTSGSMSRTCARRRWKRALTLYALANGDQMCHVARCHYASPPAPAGRAARGTAGPIVPVTLVAEFRLPAGGDRCPSVQSLHGRAAGPGRAGFLALRRTRKGSSSK